MKINCPCCCRYQTPEESARWFEDNKDCVSAFITNKIWRDILEKAHKSEMREIVYFKFLIKNFSIGSVAEILEKEKIDFPDYLKSALKKLKSGSWYIRNEDEVINESEARNTDQA